MKCLEKFRCFSKVCCYFSSILFSIFVQKFSVQDFVYSFQHFEEGLSKWGRWNPVATCSHVYNNYKLECLLKSKDKFELCSKLTFIQQYSSMSNLIHSKTNFVLEIFWNKIAFGFKSFWSWGTKDVCLCRRITTFVINFHANSWDFMFSEGRHFYF